LPGYWTRHVRKHDGSTRELCGGVGVASDNWGETWAEAEVGGAHSTVEAGESQWREGALVQGVPEGAEDGEIGMSLETPDEIGKLQKALYNKAKQEPKFRFYSLYDKVYRWDILVHAYRMCRAKNGAPGVDGITFENIDVAGVKEWLTLLQEEVRTGRYKSAPVRRVMIPKPGGVGERPRGIPTSRDRVVQMAAKLVLEPIFEAGFDEAAFGYRPGRDALQAVEEVHTNLRERHTEVVDGDLSKYFDTIPHVPLLECIRARISDGRMLHLIKMWLKAPVEETGKDGSKRLTGGKKATCGTPQGGVISPLLANIYMHRFIRAFRKHGLAEAYGAVLVNYADDFVVLCRAGAHAVRKRIAGWMNQIGLELNPKKTRVLRAWDSDFPFLGYVFGPRYTFGTNRQHLGVEPSQPAMKRFRENISKELRCGNQSPMRDVVKSLNDRIRGWGNYFCYGAVSQARKSLDKYVEERVRYFMRRRSKLLGRGRRAFTKDFIRDDLGVLSLDALRLVRSANAL
jgi:RNA-directed DNA polymerase